MFPHMQTTARHVHITYSALSLSHRYTLPFPLNKTAVVKGEVWSPASAVTATATTAATSEAAAVALAARILAPTLLCLLGVVRRPSGAPQWPPINIKKAK